MTRYRFDTFPVLQDDHVLLRKVDRNDAAAVRDVTFYDGVPARSVGEAEAMIAHIDDDYGRGESIHWGICPASSDTVVGTCGFYRGFEHGRGEVGYVLRASHRGRGIMTAALRLVVGFGLEELELDAIVAHTTVTNRPSVHLLRRLGFRRIATQRSMASYEVRSR